MKLSIGEISEIEMVDFTRVLLLRWPVSLRLAVPPPTLTKPKTDRPTWKQTKGMTPMTPASPEHKSNIL